MSTLMLSCLNIILNFRYTLSGILLVRAPKVHTAKRIYDGVRVARLSRHNTINKDYHPAGEYADTLSNDSIYGSNFVAGSDGIAGTDSIAITENVIGTTDVSDFGFIDFLEIIIKIFYIIRIIIGIIIFIFIVMLIIALLWGLYKSLSVNSITKIEETDFENQDNDPDIEVYLNDIKKKNKFINRYIIPLKKCGLLIFKYSLLPIIISIIVGFGYITYLLFYNLFS